MNTCTVACAVAVAEAFKKQKAIFKNKDTKAVWKIPNGFSYTPKFYYFNLKKMSQKSKKILLEK